MILAGDRMASSLRRRVAGAVHEHPRPRSAGTADRDAASAGG
ncbi:hypothetical protein L083_2577 [Actinoplanes sp. N902-109]|nr:hypothetical protein L083_2577 [Actinoplanes sp. N902-109]